MNEPLLTRIRRIFEPELEDLGPGRPLPPDVVATLHALLQVLADDPELPAAAFEESLQRRAVRSLAQAREYVAGAALLETAALRKTGVPFAVAGPSERGDVLRSLLGEYAHPDAQPALLRRLRLTSRNLHLVVERPAVRRFRKFVVAELLGDYYSSARGWAVVGYDEFPGFVRGQDGVCEVRAVSFEGRNVVLELSDACYERLRPDTLRVDAQGRFTCRTKGGRQEAVFSRGAQLSLLEHIDVEPDGARLRVAGSTHTLDVGDALG